MWARPIIWNELSLARVQPRPARVRFLERHFRHTQAFLPLGRKMAKKLKVYAGPEHPHDAQKPEPLNLD